MTQERHAEFGNGLVPADTMKALGFTLLEAAEASLYFCGVSPTGDNVWVHYSMQNYWSQGTPSWDQLFMGIYRHGYRDGGLSKISAIKRALEIN